MFFIPAAENPLAWAGPVINANVEKETKWARRKKTVL
jgi:hypothetical protein